jgi:hypothetical protein
MEIASYKFGAITINGREYTDDVIIYPDRVEPEWFREQGHSLSVDDLEGVFKYGPDNLVVGRGAYGRMVIPRETRSTLQESGIELISGITKEMCDLFNRHMREGRKTVGAFHLTC